MHVLWLGFLYLQLLWQATVCLADTAIVNFDRRDSLSKAKTQDVFLAIPTRRSVHLTVNRDDPSLWAHLGVNEEYQKWTVRLSWPGSSPTIFSTQLFNDAINGSEVLLHIIAKPLSPHIPTFGTPEEHEWSTDFHILLEPLVLGLIPETSLSLIWVLLATLAFGLACRRHVFDAMCALRTYAESI